jgi:ADP-ribosylglycohydrolase
MLVQMAIGDAYGAAFEFVRPPYADQVRNDGRTYQRHPEPHRTEMGNGRYTDDTQMALAIAEHLIAGDPFTPEALCGRFVETFRRDPRPGYGKHFYAALNQARTGAELLALMVPGSTRSGAAMRSGSIGLLADLDAVLDLADRQASVTHDSPEARASARAVAAMTHYCARRLGPKAELGSFLERVVPGHPWAAPKRDWITVEGLDCARAAVTVVREAASLKDALIRSIAPGGDVDTVAAIALFAGSLCRELDDDLPRELYEGLENGPFGLTYLDAMDKALADWAGLNKTI